ncbi:MULTISPECIES: hypothetical protein [Weeksella]|uniref:hypothetical protein n=1 Tax=Weeksella TaxID=1013 RepID=UPI0008A225BD|nr:MULTISPECIES: hypothetical protein [Weeksella]MDK7375350.1 hypothetical protein [Weeksella virosa]MDK7676134.1 hypothetical protein [Weeksella virosa]OFM82940.1 hypothetical protein HMPREF2660_02605 [Weeksella sp. HMSC059D05]SUP53883.1 Uncharacterised protein [Weeksella virosa]
MAKDDFIEETLKFDVDRQTFEIDVNSITRIGLENLLTIIQYIIIMENNHNFNQLEYLKNQLKYLIFGEDEKLHQGLESGILYSIYETSMI